MINREKRSNNSLRIEFTGWSSPILQRYLPNAQYPGKINLSEATDSLVTSWGLKAIIMCTLK